MAHESSMSNVGFRKAYEGDDQEKYDPSQVSAAAASSGVNAAGYKDKTKIVNKLVDEDNQRRIDNRYKHDPTYAANMHGNEPSRGAKVDAQIEEEEAEMLAKKKDKTDSLPGKKLDEQTEKSGWKRELDEEAVANRKSHSKSGSNTGQRGTSH